MKAVKDKIPWLFLAMGHWMAATATVSPGHQQEELVTVRAGKNITLECIGRTADQEVRWEINNMSRLVSYKYIISNLMQDSKCQSQHTNVVRIF